MAIKKVGVLGCGLMGSGIAQVSAQAGFDTIVLEADQAVLDRGLAGIEAFLEKGVAKGKIDHDLKQATLARLKGTTEPGAMSDRDLIIEAVTEQLPVKLDLFARLDDVCAPATLFASNTSSLSITQMASATRRPARFLGLHFFNPVPLMSLVEVVGTLMTDPPALDEAMRFVEAIGKTAVRTRDRTGFIVNRLLVPYLLDAMRALEEGVGSIRDIDRGMTLGCGHPMGPLTLLDLVGLDTTCSIANVFFEEFREARFAPPPLLRRMVLAGYLGRKSGRGFYDYGSGNPVPNDHLLRS